MTQHNSVKKEIFHSFEDIESSFLNIPQSNHVVYTVKIRNNGQTLAFSRSEKCDKASWQPALSDNSKSALLDLNSIDQILNSDYQYIPGQQLLNYLNGKNISFDTVKQMVENGESVNYQNDLGITPLMSASANSFVSTEILEYLLQHGTNLETEDGKGNTALWYACNQPSIEKITLLLAFGANWHHKNKNNETCVTKEATNDVEGNECNNSKKKKIVKQKQKKKNAKKVIPTPISDKASTPKIPAYNSYYIATSEDVYIDGDNINNLCRNALAQACRHPGYLEHFKNGWIFCFFASRNNVKRFTFMDVMMTFQKLPVCTYSGSYKFSIFTTATKTDRIKAVLFSGKDTHEFIFPTDQKIKKINTVLSLKECISDSSLTLYPSLQEKEWILCYAYIK